MSKTRGPTKTGIARSALPFAAILAAAAVAVSPAGCANVDRGPTVALYPSPRLPRAQVVHVFGPVGSVDGHNIGDIGEGLEVLPGCHVVWTRADAIESTMNVSVSWRPSGRPFAVKMQPGFTYVFKRQVFSGSMGSSVQVETYADEIDAQGGNVRTVQPAKSNEELAACRAEAAGGG